MQKSILTTSFKGKIIEIEETSPKLQQMEDDKNVSKDEILASYIGQQYKLNDIHGTLVRNILQDKQQQYDEEETEEDETDSHSGSETESLQDEIEAMDSVQIDANLGSTEINNAPRDSTSQAISVIRLSN